MNIYILNCPNTYNYGSMMMGENFIKYFNEITNTNNNYYVETDDNENIQRLKLATGVEEIFCVKTDSLFKSVNSKYEFILGYTKVKNLLSERCYDADLVVVLGGDDLTEDYGWKSPVLKGIKMNILTNAGIPVIMLGQTMGPYQSFRMPIMKKLLKRMDMIYPRDPITFKYLKDMGLKNISLSDDLALLPLSKEPIDSSEKEYVTYCPSELIYRYSQSKSREEWIDFNLFMINKLIEKFPNKKIVIIPHVLSPKTVDDRLMVQELKAINEQKFKDRVIFENRVMYPYEVREYIKKSFITISSRMHPVISSIECETPAIALSYSTKYWGIIGERYGLSEYILDVRYLNYEQMKKQFDTLINQISENYSDIKLQMKNTNILAQRNILDTLSAIAKRSKSNLRNEG